MPVHRHVSEGLQVPNIFCPQCGQEHSIPLEFAGKRLKCACGRSFVAPPAIPSGAPTNPSQSRYEPSRTSRKSSMIPVFCLLVAIGGGTVLASGMLGIA